MDDVAVTLELLSSKSSVATIPGVYRGTEGTAPDVRALVDFSGGRVPAYFHGYVPALNEPVWVRVVDGVAHLDGAVGPQPGEGTVVSASSGVAMVSTIIGNISVPYAGTVSSGNVVKLVWNEGPWIAGVTGAGTTPIVPSAPGGGGRRSTVTFSAIDSGSHQSGYGWRTTEVWSSASNRGCWFYGSQIADTIPDNASIVSAEIFLPNPGQRIGSRPFGRHAYASKPGGAPTISATSTLSGFAGWVPIPTSLIDHLKVNVGGLGFDLGGWWTWPGGGDSGAVRVTYDI